MKTKELLSNGFLNHVFTRNIELPGAIKLTTTDLSVLTNIYGHLYSNNLYDLLFKESPQTISTPAGNINTRDLRQFTYMRYLLPPGAYWKSDGPAYKDTAYCGGTPLALLGARNKHDVSYNEWKIDDITDLDAVYKLDLFLGHTLASTTISRDSGEKEWLEQDGLVRNSKLPKTLYNIADIREMRRLSGHSLAAYTTKKLAGIDKIDYYNEATAAIRHMMRQTWIYYGKHRSSNMILNWDDWDYIPKDVDSAEVVLTGYEPHETVAPIGWKELI